MRYLPRMFKEKLSFYFALFHEIAHIKSDYNKAKNKIVVDSEEAEENADNIVLNWMIALSIWDEIKNNLNSVEKICKNRGISLCFAVSRLAKEKYISYSSDLYNKYREKISN